jgi:predicted dehydrogenase
VSRLGRREFLVGGAAGFWVAQSAAFGISRSPNEQLGIGFVGVGGMRGSEHLAECANEKTVALCDVDEKILGKAADKRPGARKYNDFRKMLDEGKDLDAVVVSTPDHLHAFAVMGAIKLGKHVYCEKPLTHSVWEARQVVEAAAKSKVATQMGTQIHAGSNYRRVVELVQAGAIGPVKEVHVWVGGAWTAGDRPKEQPPVPEHLHWDLWLGPAPERPYHPTYHPQGWRSWWDFGGGHLADMGCHYMDLPYWALKLGRAVSAEAEGPPVHAEGAPAWLIVRYEHPAREGMPAVALTWYHGGKRPKLLDEKGIKWGGSGVLFVGDKGMIAADYGQHQLLPEEDFKDYKRPEKSIPESIGHHAEWIKACKTGSATLCHFGYSGVMTESVLLGNVAYRAGKKLDWDPATLTAKNCPEAARFVRRDYRKGWSL